jgi:hypothetical protein
MEMTENLSNLALDNQPFASDGLPGYTRGKMITGRQIVAGRGLVGWSQQDLADNSKLSYSTILRAEAVRGIPPLRAANVDAIQRALEGAGVVFLNADAGGGRGVRLRSGLDDE